MLVEIDQQTLTVLRQIMDHQQPDRTIKLSDAVDEFFVAKRAEYVSQNTINDYTITLNRFVEFIGPDKLLHEIEVSQIRQFMTALPEISGRELMKKTILNAHVALSSMWTWAVNDGYCIEHVVRKVKPPEPEETLIMPFTEADIKRLLEGLHKSKELYRAVILFLLDTGVRASEFCNLNIGDLRGPTVVVFGKGSKEREVPLSARTLRALLDYLATRHRRIAKKDPLFLMTNGKRYNRHSLGKWLGRLGTRAGVPSTHPHRFRHTFAVNFLRNGGDAISLQHMLGHSSLDMVKIYVRLASEDITAIHKRASPVENWKL